MKVHKYIKKFFDEFSYEDKRLYIPGHGVIGSFGNDNISFYNDVDIINEAHEIVIRNSLNYRGEVELPDEEVLQLVTLGKTLNNAKMEFEKKTKLLVDKINY